jgi:hypothetical protein
LFPLFAQEYNIEHDSIGTIKERSEAVVLSGVQGVERRALGLKKEHLFERSERASSLPDVVKPRKNSGLCSR